jgi:hypothetical protein
VRAVQIKEFGGPEVLELLEGLRGAPAYHARQSFHDVARSHARLLAGLLPEAQPELAGRVAATENLDGPADRTVTFGACGDAALSTASISNSASPSVYRLRFSRCS